MNQLRTNRMGRHVLPAFLAALLLTACGAQQPEATQPVETEPEVDQVQQMVESMTLEEKVGQMFFVRCPTEDAVQNVSDYHLGGYLLFGQDFEDKTADEVKQSIQAYQDAADIPLLIGVDEEGGTVCRVSRNPALRDEPFASPQDVYAEGGMDAIRSDAVEKSQLLLKLGINTNFAPVCDVSTVSEDFIYDRAFGQDAEQTAEYVRTVVDTMRDQQMVSVLKHFPGYGNNVDTHTGIAYDERSYDIFEQSDFLPFQAGIDEGAEMVLVSHNIVTSMDAGYPASLSPRVHEILRDELGFPGVTITDDLSMDGVREIAGDEDTAVLAVLAGNDMLCCTDYTVQIPAVIDAVHDGRIDEEQIDEAVYRILTLKRENGLW